jgi:peptide/nickel transport system ATP-binding protein
MDPDHRREHAPLTGDPPNPVNPPSGCRFRTRCSFAEPVCAQTVPELAPLAGGQAAACLVVNDPRHSRNLAFVPQSDAQTTTKHAALA